MAGSDPNHAAIFAELLVVPDMQPATESFGDVNIVAGDGVGEGAGDGAKLESPDVDVSDKPEDEQGRTSHDGLDGQSGAAPAVD